MPAPNKDFPEFLAKEALAAARLNDDVRGNILSLIREYEARFQQLIDSRRLLPIAVDDSSGTATGRAGVTVGKGYYHPIKPATTGDLSVTHLGTPATKAGGAVVEDIEIWDVSSTGLKLGHMVGRNAAGKPIVLTDGGGLSAPQYQGMVYCGLSANTGGWAYPFSIDVISS